MILRAKSVEGYVLGKVSEPEDKEGGEEWKKWSATDSLVLTWMFNSLTPSVAESVEALSTSIKVWDGTRAREMLCWSLRSKTQYIT